MIGIVRNFNWELFSETNHHEMILPAKEAKKNETTETCRQYVCMSWIFSLMNDVALIVLKEDIRSWCASVCKP